MQTYIGPSVAPGGRALALFKVRTREGEVYMSVGRSESGNEGRAVVEVRRDALLGLWRNDTTDAARSRDNLALAGEGFRFGPCDPAPLVEVRCRVRSQMRPGPLDGASAANLTTQPYISVIDGVARALWLASQGAACFPVECLVAEAPLLTRLAGMRRSRWMRVSEMLPH